ncbi:hypothetical protein H6F42_12980 [Pseudanabaena sp. FACHB-1998]|uniref:DUF3226 domain-containing protein n=1 Tax=Pseudanabaena sp. FACHB-1998 TaxID=2692858 RepID=UPI00168175AF|nr:DUF3226 domain-containing protein [Pseudanabaena sp. FACHB-1998]MBD2177828.1 hypothetical protein [Pseudanabaena sp. FACHB-1998]
MSNRLIVESKNDKFFIQAMVKYLNISNVDILEIKVTENDYLDLDGLSVVSLERELKTIEADAQKSYINKVGIILDADDSYLKNLHKINEALAKVFPNNQKIEKINYFTAIHSISFEDPIQIACYFVNVSGIGELEKLLKEIKAKDSTYADCLGSWQVCLQQNGKNPVSSKDFDKFWISNYLRFDTCSNRDKKQSERKCSMSGFSYVMTEKLDIWNFEHPALNELKEFLKLFD